MLLPIEGNNIIIGNVRIRQLRVKAVAVGASGCHIPDMVHSMKRCILRFYDDFVFFLSDSAIGGCQVLL
jgi:hypothetical protein